MWDKSTGELLLPHPPLKSCVITHSHPPGNPLPPSLSVQSERKPGRRNTGTVGQIPHLPLNHGLELKDHFTIYSQKGPKGNATFRQPFICFKFLNIFGILGYFWIKSLFLFSISDTKKVLKLGWLDGIQIRFSCFTMLNSTVDQKWSYASES